MEGDKRRKIMMILPLLLVFIGMVANVRVFLMPIEDGNTANIGLMKKISTSFSILSLIAATIYIVTEFTKKSAKYMKLFIYSFCLSQLTTILAIAVVELAQPGTKITALILLISSFLLLNLLFLKQNLGQWTSQILAIIVYLVYLVLFVVNFVETVGHPEQTVFILLRCIANLTLSFVLVVMQYLKYYDKKQRNTD